MCIFQNIGCVIPRLPGYDSGRAYPLYLPEWLSTYIKENLKYSSTAGIRFFFIKKDLDY